MAVSRRELAIFSPDMEKVEGETVVKQDGRLRYLKPVDERKGEELWDVVGDFRVSLEGLRDELGLSQDRDDFGGRVEYGENLAAGEASRPFTNITRLANAFDGRLGEEAVQLVYVANFIIGNRSQLHSARELVGTSDVVVLAPERGAWVQKMMMMALGYEASQMPNYRASRVMVEMPDGGVGYTVGVQIRDQIPKARRVVHVDDCQAGGGTEKLMEELLREKFGKPEVYVSVAGVAGRRAVNKRARTLLAEDVDFRILASAESHGMNRDYYLTLTSGEKEVMGLPDDYRWRVNDMGEAMNLSRETRDIMRARFEVLTQGASDYDDDVLALTEALLGDRYSPEQVAGSFKAWAMN